MEVVIEMDDKLDDAISALSELRSRLDREHDKLTEAKERQGDLRRKRLDPTIPLDAEDQREAIAVSHEVSDGESIIADLESKILERQETITSLTRENARLLANVLVGQVLDEYDNILISFSGPVQRATDWLQKAQQAAGAYAKNNPGGFTSVNHQLRPRIEAMAHLLLNIENGRKI